MEVRSDQPLCFCAESDFFFYFLRFFFFLQRLRIGGSCGVCLMCRALCDPLVLGARQAPARRKARDVPIANTASFSLHSHPLKGQYKLPPENRFPGIALDHAAWFLQITGVLSVG